MSNSRKQVALAGPLPPPVGGAAVSFQTFLQEWTERYGRPAVVINTAPRYMKTTRALKLADVWRGFRIAFELVCKAPRKGAVLAFVNVGLGLRFAPFLGVLQSITQSSVVLSFFGGVLHDDLMTMPPKKRARKVQQLNRLHRVIVETDYLGKSLVALGLRNVTTVPGYRRIELDQLPHAEFVEGAGLRVVFLSQVRREKGIFELLAAMELVSQKRPNVHCDIYGPVAPDISEEFERTCARIPAVRYCGVVRDTVPALLARYHVLALPTWHRGEGHPGVVIEAMMAGIPVVSTRFRAVPELVHPGVNGLLVEPKSADELAAAILSLADAPEQVKRLGETNRQQLQRHSVAEAVKVVHALTIRD